MILAAGAYGHWKERVGSEELSPVSDLEVLVESGTLLVLSGKLEAWIHSSLRCNVCAVVCEWP